MAYSAEADINQKITANVVAQLTDDSGGITTDSVNLSAAITDADSLVNGYLQAQYTIPLSSTPELVKQISIDLTVYNLYTRRTGRAAPEKVEEQYNKQIKLLEKINQNKIKLPLPDEFANTGGTWSATSKTQVYGATFESVY